MLGNRRGTYLQLAVLLLVIAGLLLISHFFPLVALLGILQQRVIGLGDWAGIFYPLLFAGCNVLLLPGGVLCVGAGFFFGLWWGFFIVLLGNSIAAAVSFAISRGLGVRWLQRRRAATPLLSVLEKAVERDARKIIF